MAEFVNLTNDTSFFFRKSKLDVVPEKELEQIAKLIYSKKLSYKKAVEIILKNYPEIGNLTLQNLRYYLIHKGFIPNKDSLEKDYKRLSKQEILKIKRRKIAEILYNEILEDKEKTLQLLEAIVSKKYSEEDINRIKNKISPEFIKLLKILINF